MPLGLRISTSLILTFVCAIPLARPRPVAAQAAQAQAGPNLPPLFLQNASLIEVIDILARALKINYILDPRVKGGVTINTYGEIRAADVRPLLETILRMNGFAMVQVGEIFRIVPIGETARLPIPPTVGGKELPTDERMVLNLIFLKFATVSEIAKLIEPFLGEGFKMGTYEPANLLLLLDNARNMRRTMELISMFDSDVLASQRVKLFDVTNGRPSDIVKELETVMKSLSLSEKSAAVRFLPVDRINTIIAVAPNPGVFVEVEQWIQKLDVPVKVTAGSVDNYVYRLKYGRAETLAGAIMQLYGFPMFGMGGGYGGGYGGFGGGYGGGYGSGFGGGYPGAGFGSPYGGMGSSGMGASPYGPGGGYGGAGFPPGAVAQNGAAAATVAGGAPGVTGAVPGGDLTGSYLGAGAGMGYGMGAQGRIPRIIPNPFDNTLMIQGTPQEWEQISKLLEQLDVPPRQVLIEAKIYEVNLTGAFASGVGAFLASKGTGGTVTVGSGEETREIPLSRILLGASAGGGIALTAGVLVGQSRELLAFLTAQEDNRRSKIISAPSVIATDSIPASINVGVEVPTLSSQALSPVQSGGSSLFTNTVQNRNTGVTLRILTRVNSSGIVTMVIDQEVSAPQAPAATSAIQSPSFSKRNVNTQVTVQDGDTVAIGGIIQETDTYSSAGIPVLHRIPGIGALFGNKSITKGRTELIIFLTPRVIYDSNQIVDASDELLDKLKRLQKMIKD